MRFWGPLALVLAGFVATPQMALAQEAVQNVPIAITVISSECLKKRGSTRCETPKPKPDRTLRKFCRKTWHDRGAFLEKVRRREVIAGELQATIFAFQFGDRGCGKNPAFATQLLDAAIGNPVSLDAEATLVQIAANWAAHGSRVPAASETRIDELEHAYWLLVGQRNNLQRAWPDADQKLFLARPENWQFVMARLNRNDAPARLAVAMLWDKDGPKFDPQMGLKLADESQSSIAILAAAKALLAGDSVERDEPRARRLLSSIAYNFRVAETIEAFHVRDLLRFEDLHSQTVKIRDAAWHEAVVRGEMDEISQGRIVVDKPDTAGVLAMEPVASLQARAKTGGYLELKQLPTSLTVRPGFINENDYPPSARRKEEQGLISTWIVFRPDGEPGWLQMVGGSPNLRAELARILYRRRFRAFHLDGYAGRYVRAPLVSVWFWISDCDGAVKPPPAPTGVELVEGKLYCGGRRR